MSIEVEGEQYYRELSEINEPDDQVERMLDMTYAIEKALDDWEAEADDDELKKENEEAYKKIEDAVDAVGVLHNRLLRLISTEAPSDRKQKEG
jgi:hypothetical protein